MTTSDVYGRGGRDGSVRHILVAVDMPVAICGRKVVEIDTSQEYPICEHCLLWDKLHASKELS